MHHFAILIKYFCKNKHGARSLERISILRAFTAGVPFGLPDA